MSTKTKSTTVRSRNAKPRAATASRATSREARRPAAPRSGPDGIPPIPADLPLRADDAASRGGDGTASAGHPASAGAGASHDEVAREAYWRYLSRQGEPGSDVDDWLAAERDVLGRSRAEA